jgi:hypothetical protein
MDVCPDNSTACLLGQILQQLNDSNNQYNWDPITFGFTAPIIVAAFLIAWVALFDQLLGVGRAKSGPAALGPWSSLRKLRFSGEEKRFRTIAYAPPIDIRHLEREMAHLGNPDPAHKTSQGQRRKDAVGVLAAFGATLLTLIGLKDPQRKQDAGGIFTASWATLLTRIGLADPKLWRNPALKHDPNFRPGLACKTDQLPSDILAVPTKGSMKLLAFLAALVNDSACSITRDDKSRLILVRAHTSDLSARYHDMLGPVAIFEHFGEPESAFPALRREKNPHIKVIYPTIRDVLDAWKMADGLVPCGDYLIEMAKKKGKTILNEIRSTLESSDKFKTFVWPEKTWPLFLALTVGRTIFRPRLFPKKGKHLIHAVRQLSRGSIWHVENPIEWVDRFERFATMIPHDSGSEARRPSAEWIFPAHKKRSPFLKLYKADHSKSDHDDTSRIDLNKKQRRLGGWRGSTWIHDRQPNNERSDEDKLPRDKFHWNPRVNIASTVYALTRTINCTEEDDLPKHSVLESERKNPRQTFSMRLLGQHEIFCIDDWLRSKFEKDRRDVLCALLALIKAGEMQHGDPTNDRPMKRTNSDSTVTTDPEQVREQIAPSEQNSDLFNEFPLPEEAYEEAYIRLRDLNRRKAIQAAGGDRSTETVVTSLDYVPTFRRSGEQLLYYSKRDTESDRREIWLLVEVLRYRALLYAAVLDMCADSTCLLDGNFQDFVARII